MIFHYFTKKWKWFYGRYAPSGIRVWRKTMKNDEFEKKGLYSEKIVVRTEKLKKNKFLFGVWRLILSRFYYAVSWHSHGNSSTNTAVAVVSVSLKFFGIVLACLSPALVCLGPALTDLGFHVCWWVFTFTWLLTIRFWLFPSLIPMWCAQAWVEDAPKRRSDVHLRPVLRRCELAVKIGNSIHNKQTMKHMRVLFE